MAFNGKKTERLWLPRQICLDPFMACRLRDRAAMNCRKLEDEIRFCILEGLKQHEGEEFKQQQIEFPHRNSHGSGQ